MPRVGFEQNPPDPRRQKTVDYLTGRFGPSAFVTLTCDECDLIECEHRYDSYNTDGDCLADK